MLFRQILSFVVIEVAAQTNGRQYQYLPIIESFSANVASRISVYVFHN